MVYSVGKLSLYEAAMVTVHVNYGVVPYLLVVYIVGRLCLYEAANV